MRIVNFLLLLLIATLQVQLWAGEGSMATLWQLRQAIAAQTSEIEEFELRNRRLAAEVHDLQTGLDTIEAGAAIAVYMDSGNLEWGNAKEAKEILRNIDDGD